MSRSIGRMSIVAPLPSGPHLKGEGDIAVGGLVGGWEKALANSNDPIFLIEMRKILMFKMVAFAIRWTATVSPTPPTS